MNTFQKPGFFFRAFCLFSWTLLSVGNGQGSIIVGLVIDPAVTAGPNSSSTRSGPGTWHLYAVDTSSTDFGISTINVTISSSSNMAANNRAPETNYDSDGLGDPVESGFALLHQTLGNNTPIVQFTGAQPPPPSSNSSANVGVDYFPIGGFGQTASSFAAKYPNTILGPTIGSAWGSYSSVPFATVNGHNWLFLGEGTYVGTIPKITSANFTVYSNFSTSFSSIPAATVILTPEPATVLLLAVTAGAAILGSRRRGGG
jgi:hypothetical protein